MLTEAFSSLQHSPPLLPCGGIQILVYFVYDLVSYSKGTTPVEKFQEFLREIQPQENAQLLGKLKAMLLRFEIFWLVMRTHTLLPVTCCLITAVSRSELSQPPRYISVLGQFYF